MSTNTTNPEPTDAVPAERLAAGKATPEQLNDLHQLVASSLLTELKAGKPSAEVLSVARLFLQSNGLCGLVQTDTDRAAMRRLWALLLRQLLKAMGSGSPSASVLAEVRLFLQSNGITKDQTGHTATTSALASLTDAALPFTTHH